VYVQAGKKYQFSAQVNLPAGGTQCYMQFYLSNDPNIWVENNGQPFTNLFMSLNTWHGWPNNSGEGPTVALTGELTQLVHSYGNYGPYASMNGCNYSAIKRYPQSLFLCDVETRRRNNIITQGECRITQGECGVAQGSRIPESRDIGIERSHRGVTWEDEQGQQKQQQTTVNRYKTDKKFAYQ
ncbi:MAG: hypothetical protein ACRDFB_04420, partial [Rhabdochlamydiaceae bacterium]